MRRAELEKISREAKAIAARLVAEYEMASYLRGAVKRDKEKEKKLSAREQRACSRMNDAMAAANYLGEATLILDDLGYVED